ncbi:MAG: hypothetical protein AAGE94_11600 [Acidobacteriota bacterium]
MRPIRSMVSAFRFPVLLSLALTVSLLTIGCQPKSPEQQVADARSRYVVELQSFFAKVDETEAADPAADAMDAEAGEAGEADPAAEAAEVADGEAAEGEATDGEAEVVEPEPQPTTIFFDLMVFLDGPTALPGLTVEITRLGLDGAEKDVWLRYVELPKMIKGETQQVSFEEDVMDFADGEGFSVNLQSVVPAERQGEYREFAEFAAGN